MISGKISNLMQWEIQYICRSSARQQGTSSKFHLPWTGPFLVVGKVSDLVYQIQRSSKYDLKYEHHDRLKPAHVKLDNWLQGSNDKVLGSTLDQGNRNVNLESHGFNNSVDNKKDILISFPGSEEVPSDQHVSNSSSGKTLDNSFSLSESHHSTDLSNG